MRKNTTIELLSPAGSIDALKQAVHNGADAIYLGGTQFGARAYASNFDNEQLKQAVEYAHLYGVKIHITANTLIYENEIEAFQKYIKYLVSIGVDVLIIQDIGMAEWVINSFNIPVHSSTQMHNYSLSNVKYLKQMGFDRAVLARETELGDIAEMSKIMETEVFAHGALCICYSGQCLFSAVEHQRSGNRGKCAQACRMKYSLYADGQLLAENKHLLSPKDLALLEDVEKLIDAGTDSIKLEGRMKSPEYVGFITKKYREIIDNYYNNKQNTISSQDTDTLKRLFNRGFTKGYIFGLDNQALMTVNRPNHAGVHIGDVITTSKEFITVKLFKELHQGDGIKLDKIDKGFVCNKIYLKGKLVSKGEAGQTIQLDNKLNLHDTDKLLLTKDITLLKSLDNYDEKKIPVTIHGEFRLNHHCNLTITDMDNNQVFAQGAVVEQSKNAPLSEDSIIQSLSKFGDSPYALQSITVSKDDNIFLSKGNINKLRRDAVEMLNKERTRTMEYNNKVYENEYTAPLPLPASICCSVTNEEQLKAVLEYGANRIYIRNYKLYEKHKTQHSDVYYFLGSLNGNVKDFKYEKLVICDTGGIRYAKENDVIADHMLNITNSCSLAHMHRENIKSACLSIELEENSIKSIAENYKKSYGNLPNAEMLVYGRIQLMATKHCMIEGNLECGKCRTSKLTINDIKGNSFPVTVDENCNNYIYSKEPIDKTERVEYLQSIGINGFRLDFFDESPQRIEAILNKISVKKV